MALAAVPAENHAFAADLADIEDVTDRNEYLNTVFADENTW